MLLSDFPWIVPLALRLRLFTNFFLKKDVTRYGIKSLEDLRKEIKV